MVKQIPMVDYLVLADDGPYLEANKCDSCGASYLGRRVACGNCGATSFGKQRLSDKGTLRAFTIVSRSAPGIKTPFISGVIDLEGGGVVKANVVDVEPDPNSIKLGMSVRMTTYVAGTDDEGTEAVAFGYSPSA